MKSECLNCFTQGVHTHKNCCFDAWLCKHQFPRSFYNTSLETILNSKSCVWSFTGSGGVNMQLQVGSTFMDISITPRFPSGFCTIRIYRKNATMCTRWAWSTSAYFLVGKTNKSSLMQSCFEFRLYLAVNRERALIPKTLYVFNCAIVNRHLVIDIWVHY